MNDWYTPYLSENGPERPDEFRRRAAAGYTAERALRELRYHLERELETAEKWANTPLHAFPGSAENWQRWVRKAAWLRKSLGILAEQEAV